MGKIYLYHDDETGEDIFRYGVAGDLILGKLFLGKELNLLGSPRDDGTYAITLNENGLTIINDGTTAGIVIKDSKGNKQLYADSNGNLNLSGNIYATSGNIAGWSIESDRITKVVDLGSNNLRRVAICSDENSPAFYVTPSNEANSIFKVNWDGSVVAIAGKIGGLNINTDGLYFNSGNTGFGIWGTTARADIAMHAGATSANMSSAPFKVYHDGSLYATSANITGTINATSGKIAAWDIDNGGMYYSNGTSGCGLVGDNRHADIAIYAGANTTNISGAPFRVYHDGSLYASKGNVGSWTISQGIIRSNSCFFGSHVKVVTQHIRENYLEICEDIRHTKGNKELYAKRKETIERLFGTAKEHHGFRYTQMVGKAKMEMKVGLTFACLNLKKLAKILDKRQAYTDLLRNLFDSLPKLLYFFLKKTEKGLFFTAPFFWWRRRGSNS